MNRNFAPPWVLFIDKGKPIAILPAGRPGEVANVEGMSMARAQQIVRLANELADAIFMARLESLTAKLDDLASLFPPKNGVG